MSSFSSTSGCSNVLNIEDIQTLNFLNAVNNLGPGETPSAKYFSKPLAKYSETERSHVSLPLAFKTSWRS